jgi:hypothetical protein
MAGRRVLVRTVLISQVIYRSTSLELPKEVIRNIIVIIQANPMGMV